jgi:hypothetical protein
MLLWLGLGQPWRRDGRLGWPLHIRSVVSLSDREQQLTLMRKSRATLFDVYLLFVWSLRGCVRIFEIDFGAGGYPKIASPLRRNMSAQIFYRIPSTPSQILWEKFAYYAAPQWEKSDTICKGALINVIGTLGLATRYE